MIFQQKVGTLVINKTKLSFCLITIHAMKKYGGMTHLLPLHQMEEGGQLYTPAASTQQKSLW
jgi:hypothetical protein